MSHCRINSLISVKNEKITKIMLPLLLLSLFRKPGGEAVNAVNAKKALVEFLVLFKLKRSIMSSQDWFLCWGDQPTPNLLLCPGVSAGKSIKMIPYPAYLPVLHQQTFFSSQRPSVRWLTSHCPRTASRRARRRSRKYHAK
jgi:hypothetical protein